MEAPTLRGASVVLRPFRAGDAAWYLAARDEAIFRWTTERRDLGIEEAKRSIAAAPSLPGLYGFAIADPDTDEPLGNLPVRIQSSTAVASYWVSPPARSRGLATGALAVVVTWVFAERIAEAIELEIHPANTGSRRVAERAGFSEVGLRTGCATCANEDGQVVVYRQRPARGADA